MRLKTKTLLAGLALASSTVLASAADLPRAAYKAPPAVMMAYNWSGFYAGLHAGYGWGDASVTGAGTSNDLDGGFGGGQLGFNWQAPGSPWVLGVEADISASGIGGGTTVGPFTADVDNTMFGTVRGRLGYAWDRFMLYGTGGFAWAENDASVTGPGIAISDSQTHTGWAAGAGIEWAFADRWSAKVEYMHLDLGSETYAANILGGVSVDTQLDTVKFGVNYRFGP